MKNLPIASGIIIMIFDHMTCYTCMSKDRTFDKNSMIMYIEIVFFALKGQNDIFLQFSVKRYYVVITLQTHITVFRVPS